MRLAPPERAPQVSLALASPAQFVILLPVFSLGAAAPLLRDALHLRHEQIGTLVALFFAGAILTSIPVGWLADRLGVRRLLIAMQVGSGLAVVAMLWLHTYRALLAVMGLAGVGNGAVMVLTNKALYDWFPRERRATAMGTKFLAVSLAGFVAGAAVPTLALWVGWRQAFGVLGGLILASALSDSLLYHDPSPAGPRPQPLPAVASRRALGRNRSFWYLVIVGFLFAGVHFAFITYLTLFLHDRWALSLPLAGSLLALAQGGAAASRVPYGWVSDRWCKGERRPLLQGIGGGALGALLALLLMPKGTPYLALAAVICLFGMSGLGWGGLYATLATELAGGGATGLGSGIASACFQAGSMVTPVLFGAIADTTGSYTGSWGMLVLWLLLGIGLLHWVETAPSSHAQPATLASPAPDPPVTAAGPESLVEADHPPHDTALGQSPGHEEGRDGQRTALSDTRRTSL